MSNSLNSCKLRRGWIAPFLVAIKNGYNEKNAANRSGQSTNIIHRHMDNDPEFKAQYDEAKAHASIRPRYGHGAW